MLPQFNMFSILTVDDLSVGILLRWPEILSKTTGERHLDAAFAVPDAYDQRGVILQEVERMGEVSGQQNLSTRGQTAKCCVSGAKR